MCGNNYFIKNKLLENVTIYEQDRIFDYELIRNIFIIKTEHYEKAFKSQRFCITGYHYPIMPGCNGIPGFIYQ